MIRTTKRRGQRLLFALCAMLLLCAMPLSVAAAKEETAAVAKGVIIELDGKAVKMNEPVRKLDEKVIVTVSSMSKLFGAKLKWDKKTEEATLHTKLGDTIVLSNEVPVVYFNEERYVTDQTPLVVGGHLYVNLREMAEMLHATVKWNDKEDTVELKTVAPAVVTEEYGLAEISKETGKSKAKLLDRNERDAKDVIKPGTKLRVVMPSIFDHKAKPFTNEDLTLLAKITQIESGNESYEGQLGVANVILNRVKDPRFPDTIKGVIYSGRQFPPAHNGMLDKSKPNASVMRAAKDALNGKNNVKNAVYFFNPKVSKGEFWDNLDVIVTIGHHSFAK
ncbi:cell wall hydrolase [Paenibacillus sp. GCM10027627]|uniref:cell wall hydrolase n=1 Tax=unclassified Paenibacillus TaxID=185978 RepID=UPI00363F3793